MQDEDVFVDENVETALCPVSSDKESGSAPRADVGRQPSDAIEDMDSSVTTFEGGDCVVDSKGDGSRPGLVARTGGIRRLSTRVQSILTDVTEGQLRPIDVELSAQRSAVVGSPSSQGYARKYPGGGKYPLADGVSRRDAIARADCGYGMDAVGNHIGVLNEWVVGAHLEEDGATPSVVGRERHGFTLRRAGVSRTDEGNANDKVFPSGVKIDSSFELALAGLNSCLYEADQKILEDDKNGENGDFRIIEHVGDVDRIIEAVARIPGLMKTALLIEDDEDRDFVFSNPVIRRAMLCPYSIVSAEAAYEESLLKQARQSNLSDSILVVSHSHDRNSWLLNMLKSSDGHLTDKAIDYMEMLSFLSAKDFVSIRQPPSFVRQKGGTPWGKNSRVAKRSPSPKDEEDFNYVRDALFKTVGSLNLIIPHLFKLHKQDIERASTLPVISRALDDAISQPFFMLVTFFDSIFHVILLFSFRFFSFQVVAVRQGADVSLERNHGVEFLTYLSFSAGFYFSFRMLGNIISMSRISWHVFRANFFNLWQLVEMTAVTLVMVALAFFNAIDVQDIIKHQGNSFFIFIAVTTGLLWLNFVGFLRVLNWKLATFVLAILQIIRDICLFLFLMLILVMAFGDMFYTIIAADPNVCSSTKDWMQIVLEKIGITSNTDQSVSILRLGNRTGDVIGTSEEDSPFCEERGQAYFSIYRVLIGDVSAEEFAHDPLTTALFIIMTFLGIIIMLNILIAIVDESYQRSTMRAERLFGRARITMVAKISALEQLLHPRISGCSSAEFFSSEVTSCSFLLHNFMRLLAFGMAGSIALNLFYLAKIILSALENFHILGIALTVAMVIPIGFFIIISSTFLLTGWKEGRTRFKLLQKMQYTRFNKYCFMYPVALLVHNTLGTSRSFHRKKGSHEEEWHGRLNFISRRVQTSVSESESRMKDMICRLESKLEKAEEQRRSDAIEFENLLDRMEDAEQAKRKRELEGLEKRVVQIMTVALSKHLKKAEVRKVGQQHN